MAMSGDHCDASLPTLPPPGGHFEGSSPPPDEETPVQSQPESPNEPTFPLPTHRINEILQPEFPPAHALAALKTQPEAHALFESPEHLQQLQIPDATKVFVRVLKNPQTGGVVYLIGTVHVSSISKDDVRMLIEAVVPEVVAIELDPLRLLYADTGLTGASNCPTTTWEVFKLKFKSGTFLSFWGDYLPVFLAQALGTDYGADMMSAIQTARRLDIPLELIDRDARITAARIDKEDASNTAAGNLFRLASAGGHSAKHI